MEYIREAIILSSSLPTNVVRLIGLKDPRSDIGVSFQNGNYVGVAPGLRDIFSRNGNVKYVKNEFDCIGTEIFKKWRCRRKREPVLAAYFLRPPSSHLP